MDRAYSVYFSFTALSNTPKRHLTFLLISYPYNQHKTFYSPLFFQVNRILIETLAHLFNLRRIALHYQYYLSPAISLLAYLLQCGSWSFLLRMDFCFIELYFTFLICYECVQTNSIQHCFYQSDITVYKQTLPPIGCIYTYDDNVLGKISIFS